MSGVPEWGELLMKSLSEIKVYYSVFGFIFGRHTKAFFVLLWKNSSKYLINTLVI